LVIPPSVPLATPSDYDAPDASGSDGRIVISVGDVGISGSKIEVPAVQSVDTYPLPHNPEIKSKKQRDTSGLPPRTRRLLADERQVRTAFRNFPAIRVRSIEGDPPDSYQIEYHIRGLSRGPNGTPVPRDEHLMEMKLTLEYPRQSPKCRMLSPIFHPNFEPAMICVADNWTAGERLVDLIIRIGEMIAYQAYNIKSPLDGEAAMWADHNRSSLPTDSRDLTPPDLD
jgi:ubiquitin-protein ligase